MAVKKIVIYGAGNAREIATYKNLVRYPNECEVVFLYYTPNSFCQILSNGQYVESLEEAIDSCRIIQPDHVFVLSPNDTFNGSVDEFEKAGFKVFGVTKSIAVLEESKVFSKNFMAKYGIPTPKSVVLNTMVEAEDYLNQNWIEGHRRFVIKGDNFLMNAFDRVATPENLAEAIAEVGRIYAQNGEAGILIEERLEGYELSLHLLVDGNRYYLLPPVQDYKRLYPGNKGPITHGIASVAESAYPESLKRQIETDIIKPTLAGLAHEKIEYKSLMYIGVMVVDGNAKVLEYNVRSGNPEWVALLGLLNSSFLRLITKFANKTDSKLLDQLWLTDTFSAAVFGLSHDYPDAVGLTQEEDIHGLNVMDEEVFPDSIQLIQGKLINRGGRVFCIRKISNDWVKLKEDLDRTFQKIHMNGLYRMRRIQRIFSAEIDL